ncbi:MAG: tRNA pseudouridine(13) synthase TruD [Methylococcaceae bacterium]|nr:tRNA pseudouridine(13) synthase TruD [Methylococcaceae bacterium]MDZ4157730.1 tRNA pseudouridine(13) synthase TruD [Methylococcales bacterium]MDP2392073.1 tRNA pseudouridine(13) synthase TruD [Methylococcaceae bacterium]MDP3020874.1 tRNA pseudouridine(13) synthase TruD [Methylococcaceae bacterium]MDP3391693.1 tRNA pseudouridine(13) synthase TruD [Methylococcaceae bacterium]
MPYTNIPEWPAVYGGPSATGDIRTLPEDFIVEEQLSFEPSGSGEHAFLYIQKTGENTEYVARMLARFAGVRQRDVSVAGLKDRHAVTSQWFSVWLPGKQDPDWTQFESDSIKVLQAIRHARKLKRGVLSGNRFKLTIRNWQGDKVKTAEQLQAIKDHGIANYFGSQRFGNQGQNINKALAMFQGAKVGREQRSIYLSAARSFLFNLILGYRVTHQLWNQPVAGDTYSFDGGHSSFKSEKPDDEILRRLQAGIIHPTGALWGKGDPGVSAETLAIEQNIIADHTELAQGLIAADVDLDRRALRVNVPDLSWQFDCDDVLVLEFTLPAGSYATAVLREIVQL